MITFSSSQEHRKSSGRTGNFDLDWNCSCCSKLLGKRDGNRVRLRFASGHQYDCSLPVTAVCRGCNMLNELLSPK